jgi:folylpolyglutamate synthase/dihydropteroate synthase
VNNKSSIAITVFLETDAINHTVVNDKTLSLQKANQEAWAKLITVPTEMEIQPSIESAMQSIKSSNTGTRVLVTGSLHLVGGTLSYLNVDVK